MNRRIKLMIAAAVMMAVTVIIVLCGTNNTKADDAPEAYSGMPCDLVDSSVPIYSVNGQVLNPDYQVYVWNLMCEYGTTDIYRYWIAQIYQESRFVETATNGRDWGLCQLRDTYHSYLVSASGLPEGSDLKNDPYANLHAGTWLISQYYKESNHCLMDAVENYYGSGDIVTEMQYYMDVSQWYSVTERIN